MTKHGYAKTVCAVVMLTWPVIPVRAQVPEAGANSDAPEERQVSWKKLFPNFVEDQKNIWLFPLRVAGGAHVFSTLAVLGVTGGLVAADPIEARYFRANEGSYHSFNNIFSGTSTTAGILAVPAAFFVAGMIRKDPYAQHTAMLSAEAVADAEIPNVILRMTTRRIRPADVPTNGNFSDTWLDSGANPLKAKGSFASGHAASAFAVATIVARRYSRRRWVPWVAYGAAGLVAFSRVSTEGHFLSDAFFGSALGYSVGRFVVLRQ